MSHYLLFTVFGWPRSADPSCSHRDARATESLGAALRGLGFHEDAPLVETLAEWKTKKRNPPEKFEDITDWRGTAEEYPQLPFQDLLVACTSRRWTKRASGRSGTAPTPGRNSASSARRGPSSRSVPARG